MELTNLIIDKINEIEPPQGLLLFDAPTGIGKTYSSIKAIKHFTKAHKKFNHIIFITNLKKNLAIDDFKREFGIEFEQNCLFLDATYLLLMANWEKANNLINVEVKRDKEYIELEKDIQLYKFINTQLKTEINDSNTKSLILDNIKYIKNRIQNESEPNFRNYIKKKYFKHQKYNDRQENINSNLWIKMLYPTVKLEDYKVLIMSTDRFLLPIDPLYKSAFILADEKYTKNSLIFIDEFDTNKDIIIKRIIEESILYDVDFLSLFIHLYKVFKVDEFPLKFFKDSIYFSQFVEDGYDGFVESVISKNKNQFNTVYEKWHLEKLFKSNNLNTDKVFLFNDGTEIEIIQKRSRKKFYLYEDKKDVINHIKHLTKKQSANLKNVQELVGEIKKTLSFFLNGLKLLIDNLEKIKQEQKNSNNKFGRDEIVNTILSVFKITGNHKHFILRYLSKSMSKTEKMFVKNNSNFSKDGFYFIEIEDDELHDYESIMRMFDFHTTPEEMICQLASKSLIVGMSATATLETITGNFDLKYIKKQLKNNYYELSSKTSNALQAIFEKYQQPYHNNKIKVDVNIVDDSYNISEDKFIHTLFTEIFTRGEDYYNHFMINRSIKSYYMILILKILKVYVDFGKSELKSIIVFLNGFPHEEKLNLRVFNEYARIASKNHNFDFYKVEVLKTSFYKETKDRIDYTLSSNQKIMVLTTYNTVSVGKNIQYKLNNEMSANVINPSVEHFKKEKDFDAIYLTQKSFIFPGYLRGDESKKYQTLAGFLFNQEYLKRNKSIDYAQFKLNVELGFKLHLLNDKNIRISKKNKELSLNLSKIIIQTLGRINRSRYFNKHTKIYLDSMMFIALQEEKDLLKKRLLNYQVHEILNSRYDYIHPEVAIFNSRNEHCRKIINIKANTVRSSNETVVKWKEIRDFVIKNPTAKEVPEDLQVYYFYFENPIFSYSYVIGRNKQIVKLLKNNSYFKHVVSGDESGLNHFMLNDKIKEAFIKNGYAIAFKSNNFVLLPSAFIQFYKGVLGEYVGKTIFEIFGYNLVSITDKSIFEFFDYEYKDSFIDFKNWRYYQNKDSEYKKKIYRKLRKTNKKRVIVINILKQGNYKDQETYDQQIIQIPYILNELYEIDRKMLNKILEYLK